MKGKNIKAIISQISINANIALILLLITGIVLYLLKPGWLLEGGKKYEITISRVRSDLSYCFVEHPLYDIVSFYNYNKNLVIKGSNCQTGSLTELEMYNTNSYRNPPVWTDNNAWLCTKSSLSQVNLVKVFDDSLRFRPQVFKLPTPHWKQNLLNPATKIGKYSIKGWSIDNKLLQGYYLQYKNGKIKEAHHWLESDSLQLILSEETARKIRDMHILNYDKLKVVDQIADSLTYWLKTKVKPKDVFKLITNRQKADWFSNFQDNVDAGEILSGNILQVTDLDHNGKGEFLLLLGGSRFLPYTLQCYEYESNTVLWERNIYEGIVDADVIDLDDDGKDEIVLGTTAHGTQHGSAWFEFTDPYYSFFCSLLILDAQGKTWQIKGNDAHFINGSFPERTYHCLLPDKKIVFGLYYKDTAYVNHLNVLDPQTGLIDTLDFSYCKLLDLQSFDGKVNILHTDKEKLYRTVLDDQFREIENYSTSFDYALSTASGKCWFYHQGKRYWMANPLRIFDDELNQLYTNQDYHDLIGLQQKDGRTYFAATDKGDNHHIMEVIFKPNIRVNVWLIFLWSLLLVSFLVYIFTRAFFKLPSKAMDGSYAVLYNVLGLLYNWRIFGAVSIYSQPKIVSFSKKKFEEQMQDITDSFQEVKVRRLGIIKLHFYKMIIGNEMHIVQRIAHDLKNQVLFLNMQMEDKFSDSDQAIRTALSEISEKSSMLSDFSRLNLLKTEQFDLITLLDAVMLKFSAHSRFDDLIWQPQQEEVLALIDERLLQLALINILGNCLKYSPEGSQVNIDLVEHKNEVILSFSNDLINDPESISHGSGIGLIASEKVILAHGGSFDFCLDEQAVTTIRLLKH